MGAALARLKRILVGYAVAAFASGACVLGGATLLALVQKSLNGTGELVPFTHSVQALAFLTVLLMVLGALPALALGLVAEIFKIRHWLFYVLGGLLICIVMWRGLPFQASGDFQFFLFAGALGGAVYWRVAGSRAGDWKTASTTVKAPAPPAQDDILSLPTRSQAGPSIGPKEASSRQESWVRSR